MTTVQSSRPAEGSRISYVTLHDVYANLADGGSVWVEEVPDGEWKQAGEQLDRMNRAAIRGGYSLEDDAAILVQLTGDADGTVYNRVLFHGDEDDRLSVIRRARRALDDAEAALLACGYVDYSERKARA